MPVYIPYARYIYFGKKKRGKSWRRILTVLYDGSNTGNNNVCICVPFFLYFCVCILNMMIFFKRLNMNRNEYCVPISSREKRTSAKDKMHVLCVVAVDFSSGHLYNIFTLFHALLNLYTG